MIRPCSISNCPRASKWLYVVEYNNDEGYVRKRFCDLHADRNAWGWPDRIELKPAPDTHIPSGLGWPK